MNLEELKSSADQLANTKSYAEAVAAYNKILTDTGFLGHTKISNVYFNKGFCLYNLKQHEQAIECFKQALARDSAYAKSYYYLGLSFVETDGILGGLNDMTTKLVDTFRQTGKKTTHALSMLLKRARKTCRFGLILSAMSRTSVPICSPSRSQSVHMNKIEAYLACVSMFFATIFLSSAIEDWIGASNRAAG